jgi:hypothetical protein
MIFLAQIEKEGYVVGEVPKVNNALDEMDSNGICPNNLVSRDRRLVLSLLRSEK